MVGWLVGKPKNVPNLFQPNIKVGIHKMAAGSGTSRGRSLECVPLLSTKNTPGPRAARTELRINPSCSTDLNAEWRLNFLA